RALTVAQGLPCLLVVASPVVQADRDHPQRSRYQLGRARSRITMARHPLHRSVKTLRKPVAQVRLVITQLDATDAAALEPEFTGKLADAPRESGIVGRRRSVARHCRGGADRWLGLGHGLPSIE